MRLTLPFEKRAQLTSPFGARTVNGAADYHKGIDLVGLDGITVRAPCDAVVGSSTIIYDKANLTWQWGNYVRLDTGDGLYIFMCHLASRAVEAGEKVRRGDVIGVMGNTGYSFGAHLHFEVRNGEGISLDPSLLLGIPNKVGIYVNKTAVPTVTVPQEDNMTGKEIYEKLTEYLASLPESEWSEQEGFWKTATESGTVDGTSPRGNLSREQFIAVLGRLGFIKNETFEEQKGQNNADIDP